LSVPEWLTVAARGAGLDAQAKMLQNRRIAYILPLAATLYNNGS
jgi:hypothetical protein